MEGFPADMGDWGITGVFHEAGRLLSKHLRDFLPIILVFIFPASLITVLLTQFFKALYVGPAGSSHFPEPTSFWLLSLLNLLWALPLVLVFTFAFCTMAQVLRDSIYTTDLKAERRSLSLYTRVKLAFTSREVDQTGRSFERFKEASKGKKLKGVFASTLCFMLYVVITLSGTMFTPEAVAAMGLPPWTIFLFTLLLVSIATVFISYYLLVCLVMGAWLWSSKAPNLDVK